MSTLSTHVLDAASGRPAVGVRVTLDRRDGDAWRQLGTGVTDDDGRVRDLAPGDLDAGGHYHVPLLLSPFAFSTYRGS